MMTCHSKRIGDGVCKEGIMRTVCMHCQVNFKMRVSYFLWLVKCNYPVLCPMCFSKEMRMVDDGK